MPRPRRPAPRRRRSRPGADRRHPRHGPRREPAARRRHGWPERLAGAAQLLPGERRARGESAYLLVAYVARGPAEAAVGIHVELLGPADREDPTDAAGHIFWAFRVEALDVDHSGAQLPVLAVFLPDVELGELAARELEHELVGAGLEHAREVRPVRAVEARAAEAIAEADVEGELGLHALGGQVVETRHLLAAHVAPCRLVELDEV